MPGVARLGEDGLPDIIRHAHSIACGYAWRGQRLNRILNLVVVRAPAARKIAVSLFRGFRHHGQRHAHQPVIEKMF